MRTEQELKELVEKLSKLTGFIAEYGEHNEFEEKNVGFACDVDDTIAWVLGEITTERFTSDAYVNIEVLQLIATNIELRTGHKLEDFK